MTVMDWDKLRIFRAVAEAGSFTHAGEVLSLSQSAVSRQISALEESLRVPLFHRHARGLILTEQGEILSRTAREVFAKLAMAEARISESREKPTGPLKITTTIAFGSVWLTPRMREFVDLYPDIQVHLVLDDDELDLAMRQADIAIRMSPPRQPDLIHRHLFSVRHFIYAAPSYLKDRSIPQSAADLDGHRIIVYGEESRPPVSNINWLLDICRKEGRTPQILTVNNVYAIRLAIQAGLGIGSLPEWMAEGTPEAPQSDVVKILPEFVGVPTEAYFVYPEELRQSKRIEVFREFLLRKIAEARL